MPLPQQPATPPADAFVALPDPAQAGSLDDLIERLRRLKVWAGDASYESIKDRVNAAWTAAGRPAAELAVRSTVASCFQPGRRRLNTDLVLAIVQSLHPDAGYVDQWRQALRVVTGEIEAVSQVRVHGSLPRDLIAFTGRGRELDALLRAARAGEAVVICAVEGMAGVGKTQLAVHAGHLLARERAFDRVLFVDLRGFHPDETRPPADPAAVLDGFLRALGVPGHRIPHGLEARTAAYRERLAGVRALIVLDNAATAAQVRPLLPESPGCLTLITSRRDLELRPATKLTVDVLTPGEAEAFLSGAVPGVPAGSDPEAASRIARRCGYLPLALSLIAGHIRNTPGWTLTDHADRLDDRHRHHRLDSDVEHALTLSYQHLPTDRQRMLRLAALHPGQDFDAYAAAALAGTDLAAARDWLDDLCRDHLLHQATPGRYTFHDLVRAYATTRAQDQDPPPDRRSALTRLADHYLAAAAAAMDSLHPAAAHERPDIPATGTPLPRPAGPDAAIAWLNTERPTLVVVVAHCATHGRPAHAVALSRILFRYLQGGYHSEALIVHGHAHRAAVEIGDVAGQAHTLNGLGLAHLRLGRPGIAADHLRRALDRFRRIDDRRGQAQALAYLGYAEGWVSRYQEGIECYREALSLHREIGDRIGEAHVLYTISYLMRVLGRFAEALDHGEQALTLARETGDRTGEARALHCLGDVEAWSGKPAGDHLNQALHIFRQLGSPNNEAGVLESLGVSHTRLGRPDEATDCYRRALAIFRELGNKGGEAEVLNGLGEAAHLAGRNTEALDHHTAAHAIAAGMGGRFEQARAHAGLGRAYHALGDHDRTREHYRQALAIYTGLGVPEADEIRALLS